MDDLDALRRDDELLDALGARATLPGRAGGAPDELAALLQAWAREVDRDTAAALERGFTPSAPSWLLTGSSVSSPGSAASAHTGALTAVCPETQGLAPAVVTPPTSLEGARRRSQARHGRRERRRPFAGIALASAALLMAGTGGAAAAAGQGDPLHGLRIIGSAVAGLINGSSEEGRSVPTASGRGGTAGDAYRVPAAPPGSPAAQGIPGAARPAGSGSMGAAHESTSSRASSGAATRRPAREAPSTAVPQPAPGSSRSRVTIPPATAPAPAPTTTSPAPGPTAPTVAPTAPAPTAPVPSATAPAPTAPAPTVPVPPPATTAPPSPSSTCTHTDNGNNKNQKCENRDRRGPKVPTGPLTTIPQPVAPTLPPHALLACSHAGTPGRLTVDCAKQLYPWGVLGWTVDLALPWADAR